MGDADEGYLTKQENISFSSEFLRNERKQIMDMDVITTTLKYTLEV